jgi:hypothetical protein
LPPEERQFLEAYIQRPVADILKEQRWTKDDARKAFDLLENPVAQPDGTTRFRSLLDPAVHGQVKSLKNQQLLRKALYYYPQFKKQFEGEKARLLKDMVVRQQYSRDTDATNAELAAYHRGAGEWDELVKDKTLGTFPVGENRFFSHTTAGRRGGKFAPVPKGFDYNLIGQGDVVDIDDDDGY